MISIAHLGTLFLAVTLVVCHPYGPVPSASTGHAVTQSHPGAAYGAASYNSLGIQPATHSLGSFFFFTFLIFINYLAKFPRMPP